MDSSASNLHTAIERFCFLLYILYIYKVLLRCENCNAWDLAHVIRGFRLMCSIVTVVVHSKHRRPMMAEYLQHCEAALSKHGPCVADTLASRRHFHDWLFTQKAEDILLNMCPCMQCLPKPKIYRQPIRFAQILSSAPSIKGNHF